MGCYDYRLVSTAEDGLSILTNLGFKLNRIGEANFRTNFDVIYRRNKMDMPPTLAAMYRDLIAPSYSSADKNWKDPLLEAGIEDPYTRSLMLQIWVNKRTEGAGVLA